MNRIDRLSAILIMFQSSESVKPRQITERFGIGIRTVYRDIRSLEEAGIPIAGDSRIGYSLVEGFKLPPLMFTQEEAFAFLAAEKLVDHFTDSGLRKSYKLGIEKIKAVMRIAEKETISSIVNRMGILDFEQPSLANTPNLLQHVMDSISKHCRIKITYFSLNSMETTDRFIDPVGVFFSRMNWYLIGFCYKKNDYRTFRTNRIKRIEQTDIPIKKGHPPLDSFLNKLGNQDDLQKVIIEVDKSNLAIIDESRYYQGLVAEIEKRDKIELHFMTFSIDRFARWYLSYIDIAKVIFPEKLKQKVRDITGKSRI